MEIIFSIIIAVFEIALIITAYLITTRHEIHPVIQSYRWQSFLLAFVAFLIATLGQWSKLDGITLAEKFAHMFSSKALGAIVLIALLPLLLGLSIRWILARATVFEPAPQKTKNGGEVQKRIWLARLESIKIWFRSELQWTPWAKQVWLESRNEISGSAKLWFLVLLILSFAIVFLGIKISANEKLGISVSLFLHLAGLYNALSRKDVISQMVGVLTMDQGMLLAIVKIVSIPVPATLFVIAVYFYTLITVALLFLIVPSLRRVRQSINLGDIAEKSDLKG